jgi:hypothetical protein
MPRLRYGPDVTDDAASLLTDLDRIDKKLKSTQSAAARARLIKQRDLIGKGIKEVYGSRANARKMAAESLARQGYASAEDVKALGGKRYKKLTERRGGNVNLASTPGRGREAIPRKQGYQARPETAHPELYASATKKAETARSILRQIRSQETAGQAAKKKAAKKAATVKKAAKKASAVKKAAAPKKAAKKAVAAKKAAKKVATPKKVVKKVATPKKAVKKVTPKKKR